MAEKISKKRREKLIKNFRKIYVIRAFTNIRALAVVYSLFYVFRGITIEQIFYLSMIWSVVNTALEIPSSYMADRLGRKKTLIVGALCQLVWGVTFLWADSFWMFALGFSGAAASYAMFSGTGEALLYDSAKEIGEEKGTLSKLGNYHASRFLFKIVMPLIAIFLVQDLTNVQFITLILIDILATLIALGISLTLTEANHYVDVEKEEAGVFLDAWKLLKGNKEMARAMFAKVLIFSSTLMVWHYYQVFYTDIGLPLIALGVGGSALGILVFVGQKYIKKLLGKRNIAAGINLLCIIETLIVWSIVLLWFVYPNPYIMYGLFILFLVFENYRNPLFSEYFNKISSSFNRATTLSLTNALKSFLDIPLMLLGGTLVGISVISPYIAAGILCLLVILFLRLKKA